jgi:uncharacterized protein
VEALHADGGLPVSEAPAGDGPRATLDVIPATVRVVFPGLENADEADRAMVRSQLGKQYQGDILVSARCPHGRPAVVLTLPLEGSGGPVPPLLWLTCPRAVSLTGRIESSGAMKEVKERLEADRDFGSAFERDDEEYASVQRDVALAVGGEPLAHRIGERGVAGGRTGAVKCLHAHLAYFLSLDAGRAGASDDEGSGALGRWCFETLEEEGGAWCEEPPAACVI